MTRAACLILLLAGCGPQYAVRRDDAPPPDAPARSNEEFARLLGQLAEVLRSGREEHRRANAELAKTNPHAACALTAKADYDECASLRGGLLVGGNPILQNVATAMNCDGALKSDALACSALKGVVLSP